jgi:hypothetical protein
MRRILVGVAILLAGCVSGKPRALKPSVEEVFPASVPVVFQAALKAVTDQGLPLREAEPTTRVIQTNYVDMATYEPSSSSVYPPAERQVRFRVLVAPNQDGTGSVVAIFGVYAPFRTGISTSERSEREIPRDHPGMTLVRRIRDGIATAVGQ